jgi:hypothetical protein
MVKVVDELEKKVIEELKKAETLVVTEVDGKVFTCWGWNVRIYRNPSTHTPPKQVETPDNKSETPSAPASV